MTSTNEKRARGASNVRKVADKNAARAREGHRLRSSSTSPDLDWSQIRETVLMLGLAVAQIESSMRDGDESVNTLGHSFTTMYGAIQTIVGMVEDLPNRGRTGEIRRDISQHANDVASRMQEVIIAMQFYDKLTQRLSHVAHSIDSLGDLIADHGRLYSPYEWAGLQELIRAKYTTEEERLMFDVIMEGGTVEEAQAAAMVYRNERQSDATEASDDNVDLF
jgi:methyl-accepting chemotaxis protein